MTLAQQERRTLLDVARASIHHGLLHGRALPVTPGDYAPALQATAATFATLQIDGALRGCIGTLEAHRPLVSDVAANAWAAAFRDSRFPP
ncbi:MAG: AMMECR1 domain-containing protein, partial [Gammaproteobacteria bacterium]